MKNGLELANERLQIINDIQEKIDGLYDNKKLLEELK